MTNLIVDNLRLIYDRPFNLQKVMIRLYCQVITKNDISVMFQNEGIQMKKQIHVCLDPQRQMKDCENSIEVDDKSDSK